MRIVPIKDLRDFIEALKARDELTEIKDEVNWYLEMGAIVAMANTTHDKIPFFTKIKGYKEGQKVIGDAYRGLPGKIGEKLALALEMDPEIGVDEFIDILSKRLSKPIKPTEVGTGPIKENLHSAPEVDLFKEIPIPLVHEGDGGRFLTMSTVIQKDPDTDWVNWANYRIEAQTRTKLTPLFIPGQQGPTLYYFKYEARGEDMPIVICGGGHPAVFFASGTPYPPGVSEVDFAGAMAQRPIELVKGETVPLYVPADAEFAIEGYVKPYERMDEGPFGEYIGYIMGPRRPMPVVRVTHISHRDGLILPFTAEGVGVAEAMNACSSFYIVMFEPLVKGALKALFNLPLKSFGSPECAGWMCFGASSEVDDPEVIKKIGQTLNSVPGASAWIDVSVLYDKEVDFRNSENFLEEWGTKAVPERDFYNIGAAEGGRAPHNLYQSLSEKVVRWIPITVTKTAKPFIDATSKKWDVKMGPKQLNFNTIFKDYIDVVNKKRDEIGLPKVDDFRLLL